MTLVGLLLAATPRLALAQEEPTYSGHPETLDDPALEQTFAEDEPPPPEPDDPIDFEDRPLALGTMLGFGTPVGLIGAVGMYTPVTPFSVGAGAGTNGHGLQLTAMATLRPFSWVRSKAAHAISFTPAWSTGTWKSFEVDLGLAHDGPQERALYRRWVVSRAHWLQADVSYELVTRRGFWLRAGYGLAWMLNPGDAHCELIETEVPASCEGTIKGWAPDDAIFTVSVVLGHAFDI